MDVPRSSLDFITICCLRLLWDEIYDNWVEVAQDVGLTVTEEQILLVLWLAKASTVTEVASTLQRDKGTISKSIFSLERNGLVVRQTLDDRRFSEFTLTEKGEQLSLELIDRHIEGQKMAFAQGFLTLDEEERTAFARTALKLVRYVYGDNYISAIQRMKNFPSDTKALIAKLMKEPSNMVDEKEM